MFIDSNKKCQFNCKTLGIRCECSLSHERTLKTDSMCHSSYGILMIYNDLLLTYNISSLGQYVSLFNGTCNSDVAMRLKERYGKQ